MEAASTLNGAGAEQLSLPGIDERFLQERLIESRRVVKKVAGKSELPLILQFSGGKDSVAMVGLVREVTNNFVCFYMISGIEFQEQIEWVTLVTRDMGIPMLFSDPSDYKGGFFERLAQFKRFPGIPPNFPWCVRDLKLRPQRKVLEANFGKATYYKLNGVRRWESSRRKVLYPSDRLISPDPEHKGSFQVQPLLNWTGLDVANYLKLVGLPTSSLYKRYGVSGCYWCPFYQPSIYKKVLTVDPTLYDEFIEWEQKLNQPSVIGNIFLGDLKKEVLGLDSLVTKL